MKFDRQLRPAPETSWVVSYGGKTVFKLADGRQFENRYTAICQRKIIRFRWNLDTAADFKLDERHVIKIEKVSLDRLRVRQNVFHYCIGRPTVTNKVRKLHTLLETRATKNIWPRRLSNAAKTTEVTEPDYWCEIGVHEPAIGLLPFSGCDETAEAEQATGSQTARQVKLTFCNNRNFLFTSDKRRRYIFCPCSSVCLSVSKITQKRVHGFRWNVACRQMSGHGRTD